MNLENVSNTKNVENKKQIKRKPVNTQRYVKRMAFENKIKVEGKLVKVGPLPNSTTSVRCGIVTSNMLHPNLTNSEGYKDVIENENEDLQVQNNLQYKKEWEDVAPFKGWLYGVPSNSNLAFCLACKVTLPACKLTLLRHTCSRKHTESFNSMCKIKKLSNIKEEWGQEDKANQTEIIASISQEGEAYSGDANRNDSHDIDISEKGTRRKFMDNLDRSPLKGVDYTIAVRKEKQHDRSCSCSTTDKSSVLIRKPTFFNLVVTNVFDTQVGLPAVGIKVILYIMVGDNWAYISESFTGSDGWCKDLVKGKLIPLGIYRLHFKVSQYYESKRLHTVYPFIDYSFEVTSPNDKFCVSLLLSPFGFTIYRKM